MSRRPMDPLKVEAAKILAAAGWVQNNIANALGYSDGSVFSVLGIKRDKPIDPRLGHMAEMYRSGKTLTEIGAHYGITRERVRQLLVTVGISRGDGGMRVIAKSRSAAAESRRLARRDAKCMKSLGCDYATATQLNHGEALLKMGARSRQFYQQRRSAMNRGIEWNMTFPEWCAVWDESGKWELRGRGKGRYCMSRHGDAGAYSVGNVAITLNEVNISESYIHHPYAARCAAAHSRRVENERKALLLKASGMRNVDIAKQLGLSACTISNYLVNAKRAESHV